MATRFQQGSTRLRGTGLAELVMAAFAALAVAFVLVVMPEGMLAVILDRASLTDRIDPGAMGTRALLAGGGGVAAFLLLWLILRALPNGGETAKSRPVTAPAAAPKLRRADAHADAPAPRPILAAADFGEPLELVQLHEDVPAPAEPLRMRPAPAPPESAPVSNEPERSQASAAVESIEALVERLERGLKCRDQVSASASFEFAPEPLQAPPHSDQRLLKSIQDLQRFAVQQR